MFRAFQSRPSHYNPFQDGAPGDRGYLSVQAGRSHVPSRGTTSLAIQCKHGAAPARQSFCPALFTQTAAPPGPRPDPPPGACVFHVDVSRGGSCTGTPQSSLCGACVQAGSSPHTQHTPNRRALFVAVTMQVNTGFVVSNTHPHTSCRVAQPTDCCRRGCFHPDTFGVGMSLFTARPLSHPACRGTCPICQVPTLAGCFA